MRDYLIIYSNYRQTKKSVNKNELKFTLLTALVLTLTQSVE